MTASLTGIFEIDSETDSLRLRLILFSCCDVDEEIPPLTSLGAGT